VEDVDMETKALKVEKFISSLLIRDHVSLPLIPLYFK
jgi:hypothetical protein